MRQTGLVLAAVIVASSFIGCPLLKKKSTDSDDPDPTSTLTDAATVTVSGTGAKNEASVLRYANETPIANEPAVIGKDGAKARNFPGNGPEVAFLPKGTPVAKISQYFSTGVLVMFDDAAGDGTKLIGWVSPKAFDTAAPAPAKPIVVPPRNVDAGSAAPRDAGVAVVDAGSVAKDAGGPAAADAGGGLPQPPKGAISVPPVNGKCPDGWTITEGMCRHKCASDSDCPRGIKCVVKSGNKVCTSDR